MFFHGYDSEDFLKYKHKDIETYRNKKIDDLLKLKPELRDTFSDKEKHRENKDFFHIKKIQEFETSGTSGIPLKFGISHSGTSFRNSYILSKILKEFGLEINRSIILYVVPYRLINADLIENLYLSPFQPNFITIRESYLSYFLKRNNFNNYNIVLLSSASIYQKIIDNKYKIYSKLCININGHFYNKEDVKNYFNCQVTDWITCFDGSLSSWNCKYGKYHLDFEVSYAYNDKDNKIILTDYWNKSEIFYNYFNGDLGIINQNEKDNICKCGRFGPYLESFIGRSTETFNVNNKKIYGMEIYDTLFPGLNFDNCLLEQLPNKNIIFYYENGNEEQIKLAESRLNFLFGDNNFLIEEKDNDFFRKINNKKRIYTRVIKRKI